MDIEYINLFTAATNKVISTMAFIDSKAGFPRIKDQNDNVALGDLSAVIELMGKGKGSLAISFPQECILKVASSVFGDDYRVINEDIVDMVGEFINMISGETRKGLAKLGHHFSAGIPVTYMEKNHKIKHFANAKVVLIPFSTKVGEYYTEACFEFHK